MTPTKEGKIGMKNAMLESLNKPLTS